MKWIPLAILILLFFAGCSSDTIKIGYIGPLTGDAASVGSAGLAGAELAISEINARGGVLGKQLELVIEDDHCSTESVDAMQRLVHVSEVVAITGPDCGASAAAAIPIAQESGTPIVIRWASVPSLTSIGDHVFRIYPSDSVQGAFAAEYILETLGKRKAAVLFVQNDYGVGLKQTFSEEFTARGGEIVFEAGHPQDETDMRTDLIRAREAGADMLFLASYRTPGRAALKQAKELGMNIPVMGGDAFDADEIIRSPEAEGVIFPTAVMHNPAWFQEEVRLVTGENGNHVAAPLAYDSVYIIVDAIRRAESLDGQRIRDEIARTRIEGISSPLIEFDERGDFAHPEYEVRIVRNGSSLPFSPDT